MIKNNIRALAFFFLLPAFNLQGNEAEEGSYYLRPPVSGIENSAVFHNHIDANSHQLLREIIEKIEQRSLNFQNKIYPVSHLTLGPQYSSKEFASVYANLPNFHSMNNASYEAFATGKMGDNDFNYDQILATLETVFTYPDCGVMTELEEDIFEKSFEKDGSFQITLDRGLTPNTIDWSKLPGWKEREIANVPLFELHHGFDIEKIDGEDVPPIDLNVLMQLSKENGFEVGGWFIFKKADRFSYRSNEFSNASYPVCLQRLNEQADKLREIVKNLIKDREFTSSCSLEKVHAIWKIDYENVH